MVVYGTSKYPYHSFSCIIMRKKYYIISLCGFSDTEYTNNWLVKVFNLCREVNLDSLSEIGL